MKSNPGGFPRVVPSAERLQMFQEKTKELHFQGKVTQSAERLLKFTQAAGTQSVKLKMNTGQKLNGKYNVAKRLS